MPTQSDPAPVQEPSASTCPLCGQENACGMERGAATCWCFSQPIPAAVLDRVPPESRGVACVCRRCASAGPSSAEA